MVRKSKTPCIRDVYLAYLIEGARRTKSDEFPIIEEWMVNSLSKQLDISVIELVKLAQNLIMLKLLMSMTKDSYFQLI